MSFLLSPPHKKEQQAECKDLNGSGPFLPLCSAPLEKQWQTEGWKVRGILPLLSALCKKLQGAERGHKLIQTSLACKLRYLFMAQFMAQSMKKLHTVHAKSNIWLKGNFFFFLHWCLINFIINQDGSMCTFLLFTYAKLSLQHHKYTFMNHYIHSDPGS